MTLEDFFTLSEMKDGLTSPARVEELIAVMKKEKDCTVKNVGDATRQWSAVSSTIAATDNKDCLDLFIQLDGLWFINRWLKNAEKLDTDTSTSYVEEAITAMLGALEKLHIDKDRSTSSGIWITVNNLINHSSLMIQDRVRALCDRWNQDGCATDNTIHEDVEKVVGSYDNVITVSEKLTVGSMPESSALDIPFPNERAKEGNCSIESTRDEVLPSKGSGGLQTETIENSQGHSHGDYLNSPIGNVGSLPTFQEKNSTREEPQVSTKERAVSVEYSTSAPEQLGDVRNLIDSIKDASNSSDKSGVRELTAGSSILEPRVVQSGIDLAHVQEPMREPALHSSVGANKVEGATLKSETESGVEDNGVPDCSNTWAKIASQKPESCTLLQESSGKECISVISMDAGPLFSKMEDRESPLRKEDREPLDVLIEKRNEDTGSANEEKQYLGDANEDPRTPKFSKSVKDARSPNFTDKRRPNIEHDYGIVDALEVACKVAQEVKREAVDYREPSCSSSSDKASEGGMAQPCGSDSTNGKEDQTVSDPSEERPARQNLSPECPQGREQVMKSDHVTTEPENCLPDMESSQVTEAVQEPEANSERGGMCGFDLNQEICSDDMDCPVDSIATTISVVSASRPTVSPGLPVAPLQFEGTLGWKGSALTSAFRPASPRRISDGGGSSSGSKCRQDHLDFDLNVAEDGEDKFAGQTSGKQIHASFGLPSGESSVEISSKKPERVRLDLNCAGDDGDAPSADIRMERQLFFRQNGRSSPSPASSSSSMQPSMRNIDLNDRPYIQNDSSQQGPYHANHWQTVNAYGGTKSDDPVISIMGTRVEVKRKDFVPQTLSLSNGKAPEFAMDANVARTAAFLGMGPTASYTHPPAFGYNGFTAGPPMSYSSTMYGGPVPYMVDSRGAPVVPQVVGSASAIPPYAQQPFIMSVTGAPPGINSFDLNSGFVIDRGNREPSSLRQLFIPGQGRSMDEHFRANPLPSSSKRKEPDSGWEPFTFNYKHQHPPWK